jgi:hypothetical protein
MLAPHALSEVHWALAPGGRPRESQAAWSLPHQAESLQHTGKSEGQQPPLQPTG